VLVPDGAADGAAVDSETVTAGESIDVDLCLRLLVVLADDDVDNAVFAVGVGVHQVLVQLEASAEEEDEIVSEAAEDDPDCDAIRANERCSVLFNSLTYHLANGTRHSRSTKLMLSA
jgi:hypothetical protein